MAAVAQVLVLQLVAQDLLGEAGLVALHGRRGGRFLRGHGVSSHVAPGDKSEAAAGCLNTPGRDISDARVAEQLVPAWPWRRPAGQPRGPHPLFTFPLCNSGSLGSTCSNHDRHLSSPSSKPPSALPTEQRRRRSAHPLSPREPPAAVAKLSASFSQKWYPARRHAPSRTPGLLAGC